MSRILDRFGTGLAELRGEALLEAIGSAEGRTVLAEVIAPAPPLLAGTSNAELVAAFGADLICLNLVDPGGDGPVITGLDTLDDPPTGFDGLARLLGRPVGCNLEPDSGSVPSALRTTPTNVQAAIDAGAAFVVVTANPGRGVRTADLVRAVETLRSSDDAPVVFAGKMHQAGDEEPLDAAVSERLVEAGADGVLVPLPGTVPGISEEQARGMVLAARDRGRLAMGTIGTSQEGADAATIRTLALTAKRIGVDLHHIGDAGWTGLAPPERIYEYSVAIRGVRHTWNRMARGVRASWQGDV